MKPSEARGDNSDCDRCRNTPSLRPAAPLVPIEMEAVAGLPGEKFPKVLACLSNASDCIKREEGFVEKLHNMKGV